MKPLTIYLCALSFATSGVIIAGTAAVVYQSRAIDRLDNHTRGSHRVPGTPPSTVDSPQPLESPAAGPWRAYEVTAYSHGCIMPRGPEGGPRKAANGQWPTPNLTVAAAPHYAFGTVLELSHGGVVTRRVVGDRGRAIQRDKLDLFVEDCHRARAWGRRRVMVRVIRQPLGGHDWRTE